MGKGKKKPPPSTANRAAGTRRSVGQSGARARGRQPDDEAARDLRRIGAPPTPVGIWAVVVSVILLSILVPDQLADPRLIHGNLRYVAAGAAAVFAGLATATLTTTAYCALLARGSAATSAFFGALGNFATIGAIIGTLLGLRLIFPFLGQARARPGDHKQPFMEYVSLVGSTATIVTLLMIGLCWFRVMSLAKLTARHLVGDFSGTGILSRMSGPVRTIVSLLLAHIGNIAGIWVGLAMWNLVLHQGG